LTFPGCKPNHNQRQDAAEEKTMERSAAICAFYPSTCQPSAEDAALWGRVLNHLKTEAPLAAVLVQPWRWLNQRHRTLNAVASTATILKFPTRTATTTRQD